MLFAGKLQNEAPQKTFSVVQKRFVYKLFNELKNEMNKSTVNDLWKKFMTMADKDSTNKDGNPYVENK